MRRPSVVWVGLWLFTIAAMIKYISQGDILVGLGGMALALMISLIIPGKITFEPAGD